MSKLIHHALKTGTKIANFQITKILGVGGFGITYKAYDEDLERDVALKEYFPSTLALRGEDGLPLHRANPPMLMTMSTVSNVFWMKPRHWQNSISPTSFASHSS